MKVFVSYNSKDLFEATLIEYYLRQAGVETIWDRKSFESGPLPDGIRRHVEECDILAVVLTCNYYDSDWARDELSGARYLGKKILFIATDLTKPRDPYGYELPNQLIKRPVMEWAASIATDLRKLGGSEISAQSVDEFFSYRHSSNKLVASTVTFEGLASSRLNLRSTVELASKIQGWSKQDVESSDLGLLDPEDEILESFKVSPAISADNYSLVAFEEDLTDDPGLRLRLRKLPHELVRSVANSFDEITRRKRPRRLLLERSEIAYPHSLVVHMAVTTSDNFLLLGHRSSRPRFYENCWAVTYEEHMKPSEDGPDPFKTAIRGLEEELTTSDIKIPVSCVRFFSLFRELDFWENTQSGNSFWNINMGLAGKVALPWTIDDVFDHWPRTVDGTRELRHLVGVPYTFDNVWRIIAAQENLEIEDFDGLRVPRGAISTFPDLTLDPLWRRQHPTNAIRLIRCLSSDFPDALKNRVAQYQ